jgi:hypothetical protein
MPSKEDSFGLASDDNLEFEIDFSGLEEEINTLIENLSDSDEALETNQNVYSLLQVACNELKKELEASENQITQLKDKCATLEEQLNKENLGLQRRTNKMDGDSTNPELSNSALSKDSGRSSEISSPSTTPSPESSTCSYESFNLPPSNLTSEEEGLIQNSNLLTEDDIKSLNSILQYMDEDVSLLTLPAINPTDSSGVNWSSFAEARHQSRTNALDTLKKRYQASYKVIDTVEAEEINALNGKSWLEKKYQLITNQSIDLKLNAAKKELTKILPPLSPLELAAVTHKSIGELDNELNNLTRSYLKSMVVTGKKFEKIEEILLSYPALADTEAFKTNLNTQLSKVNPALQLEDTPRTKNLLHVMDSHLKEDMSKWNLFFFGNKDNELVEKIFADSQLTLQNTALIRNDLIMESDIKKIIGAALQTLKDCHDLNGTLQKRNQWKESLRSTFAENKKDIAIFREEIVDRISILKAMREIKSSEESGFLVYLPKDCEVIDNHAEPLSGACFKVSGTIFQKRDELELNQTITYKQKLPNNKHQIWSVTRSTQDSLEYQTPGKSNAWYKDFGTTPEEIAFTQMIDAVNSFKESKTQIIHFSFDGCSKDLEKKYRLFIRAYNELNQGPTLYCKENNTITMESDKIEKEKIKIQHKLTLYNNEVTMSNEKLDDLAINNSTTRRCSRGL